MLSSLCHKKQTTVWKLTKIWLQLLHTVHLCIHCSDLLHTIENWQMYECNPYIPCMNLSSECKEAHYVEIAVIRMSFFWLYCYLFLWQIELGLVKISLVSALSSSFFSPRQPYLEINVFTLVCILFVYITRNDTFATLIHTKYRLIAA